MTNFLNSAFLLAIIYITLLLPGRVISDLIIGPIKDYKNMISIILGFCFFLLISIVFYLFEWKLIDLNIFILTTSAISTVFLAKKYISNFEVQKFISLDDFQKIVLILFLIVFGIQSNNLLIWSKNLGSDYWYYAAQSNYFVETGRLSLKFPYFDAPNSMYPFSFLFTIVALLELNTGWSAVKIINHLGSVFVITAIYLNYILVEHFIKNKIISIVSICLLLILTYYFQEGIFYVFLTYPFYPKLASIFLFFPIFIYLLLNRNVIGSKYLFLMGAIIISFVNLHAQNSMWVMIYILTYAAMEIIKSRTISANIFYLLLLGVAIITVNAALIINFMYSESASVFQYNNENSGLLVNLMDMRIVNPMIYFHEASFLNIGFNAIAIFSLIGLVIIKRRLVIIKRNYILLYSCTLLVCISLIVFNPFIVENLLKVMPSFIFERFIYMVPIIFIISYLFAITLQYSFDKYHSVVSRRRIIIIIIPLIILLYSIDKNSPKISIDSDSFFKFIRNNIKKDSFVLADGATAFKLPAFKTIKVPFINEGFLAGHINLEDKNNVNLLFNDDTELEQKISIINSYDFQYIVVNKSLKSNNFLRSGIEGYSEIFNNNLYQILSRN